MSNEFLEMMEETMSAASSASNVSSLLSIAVYVFSALAIYTIAQRREIKHPWMAWVPVLNVWTLGCISDQYRYVVKGQVKNKRKVLLAVNILNFLLTIGAVVYFIVIIVNLAMNQAAFMNADEIIWKVLGAFVAFVPVMILGLVSFIFRAMAMYDLYASCEPENKVLYLVLSLIPGISTITCPLFLFLCRNKDDGMPPRRGEDL